MAQHLPEGTLLHAGSYRIIRFISSGGFGCTYEAEHVLLEKRVAIKEFFVKDFCNRDTTTSGVSVGVEGKQALVAKLQRKFIEEARGLCKLQHKGIVSVSDVFEENGTAYFVMDYIEGSSLKDRVDSRGPLPEAEALKYIRQVCDALAYVHANNRLHLDIKPGNIMIDGEDRAILIDFGASKQYDEVDGENTSTLMGKTPGYAPPEQMSNNVVKFLPSTDVYALGATLYKLLTGLTPPDALQRISGEPVALLPEEISAPTRRAVEAALLLDKTARPQTVADFLKMLEDNSQDVASTPAAAPAEEETQLGSQKQEATEFAGEKVAVPPTPASTTSSAKKPVSPTPPQSPTPPRSKYAQEAELESKQKRKLILIAACAVIVLVVGFILFRPKSGYEYTGEFYEGMAKVSLNGKWGFIDENGEEVVPLKYDAVEDFSEGFAVVRLNDKWGFIDKTGKEITPIEYEYESDYIESWGISRFSEGLAPVLLNGKCGFIDQTGRVVIPLKYDVVENFNEGLAAVRLNNKWGYVDTTGKEVISLKYDDVGYFSEGLAHVSLNGQSFYIDKNGRRSQATTSSTQPAASQSPNPMQPTNTTTVAQNTGTPVTEEKEQPQSTIQEEIEEEPYLRCETMPSFQGGDLNTFRNWVVERIRYPQSAAEANIQGRVVITFIIEKDGRLTNIEILKSPDQSLTDEVLRIVQQSPRWSPGMLRDQVVRVKYTLPLEFRIQN